MAGQVWAVNSLGGFAHSLELSNVLRTAVQPLVKFRQFCDAMDFSEKGVGAGQIFTWDVYNDVATAGTVLTETSTIGQTNFTITQGTGTVYEYGNSVPYTGLLNDLSKHPITDIVNRVLKNDCAKVLDLEAFKQFRLTPLRVAASGGTSTSAVALSTTGTTTVTNSVALGKGHIKAISDTMKERNIPTYNGDEYFCIARPSTLRQMKNDLESVYQYRDAGFQMIYRGEVGKFEGFRFIEQTNISAGIYSTSTGLFTGWSVGVSDWAMFFGADTVAEAIVLPEEMRGKIPTDFGRSRGVAWYYLGGFSLTQTNATQARVVMWDSAA